MSGIAEQPTTKKGLEIERRFSTPDGPFHGIKWESRRAEIRELLKDGTEKVIFEMDGVRVPSTWSQRATNILASKYCRKAGLPADDESGATHEHDAQAVVHRIARAIALSGAHNGYFASADDTAAFYDDLAWLLIWQYGAFNSPVLFNLGLAEAYGIKGRPAGCWRWDEAKNDVVLAEDAYTHPQISACYIQSPKDDLLGEGGIADVIKDEMRVFKFGGGSGGNFSRLRAENEPLESGGSSSGLMSFLSVYNKAAGALKSGGTTRRAAKMVILDDDHPDLLKFVEWKAHEEDKARALCAAGFGDPSDFNSEAFSTIDGQNANNSIFATDEFLRSVELDGAWTTYGRVSGKPSWTKPAREVWGKITSAAWRCADPGLFFGTTVNSWHTCPTAGRIRSSNPCQPEWATLLTPHGIRTMGQIAVGDTVWSGQRWTKVVRKVPTGVKPVYGYKTRAGTFYGTEGHRIVQDGEKVEVKDAETIDISTGRLGFYDTLLDLVDIMDGLMIGDGSVHKASNNLAYLIVGKDDKDYFQSEVKDLFIEDRSVSFANKGVEGIEAWIVKTTITAEELPKTHERYVPDRFVTGDQKKVRGFLRGLYSANGSVVGGQRVMLKASSFQVAEAVQAMLSSLGIPSYHTVNKAHDVEFGNGTYTCRESYDVNITVGRKRFGELVGFLQGYKMEKLEQTLAGKVVNEIPKKKSFGIVERSFYGDLPVYDITVEDEEHTYWTGGLLVSNCGEFVFLDDTSCNLASLNLLKFALPGGTIDVLKFRHACHIFLLAQEILVDHASYPTRQIAINSHNFRPLGLGYANLGALLMRRGVAYDSEEGRRVAADVTSLMTAQAYLTSAQVAASKGAFAGYAANKESMDAVVVRHAEHDRGSAASVWKEAIETGRQHGYRNAQVTLLAPTGTIGHLMGCDTLGIEPEYALVKKKKLAGGGEDVIVNGSVEAALRTLGYQDWARDAILAHLVEHETIEGAPGLRDEHLPVFDCAVPGGKSGKRSIEPMGHVRMMAAVQPFLSGAISKTVNMPGETTVEQVGEVYMAAWKLGLKAIAIYRDRSKAAQVLTTKEAAPAPALPVGQVHGQRRHLPKEREGKIIKVKVGGQKFFLHTGTYPDGTLGEIFVDLAKEGSAMRSLMNVFSISVSLGLQFGVPLEEYVNAFSGTKFEPCGPCDYGEIKTASSIPDAIMRILALKHLKAEPAPEPERGVKTIDAPFCRDCGHQTERVGACHTCPNCGTSMGCS